MTNGGLNVLSSTGSADEGAGTGSADEDGPSLEDVSVEIDPDDGLDHHANSVQVSKAAKIKLCWKATKAASVAIAELGKDQLEAEGNLEVPTQDATYTLIAASEDGKHSAPFVMEVHTHEPDEVVSAHVELGSGVAAIVHFCAQKDGADIQAIPLGGTVTLVALVSDEIDAITINGQEADLTPSGDGHLIAKLDVKPTEEGDASWPCEAKKGGEVKDKATAQITVQPAEASDWSAAWSATEAQAGATLQMVLTAKGLAADTDVAFDVTQDGLGPVGQVTVKSGDGTATADFADWFKPEAEGSPTLLDGDAGEQFPKITFSFKASAAGKEASTTAPATYGDRLHVQLVDEADHPIAKTKVSVFSHFGTMTITTSDDGVIDLQGVPPGGAHVGTDDGLGLSHAGDA